MAMPVDQKAWWETVRGAGQELVQRVEVLIHEGNVRRVVVKQDGRAIVEFPLTIGVVGAAIAPIVAALGAIVALATECTVEIERVQPSAESPTTLPGMGAPQDVSAEEIAPESMDEALASAPEPALTH
jgi:hypothetical protein